MAEHRIYFFKVQGKSWNPNLEQFFWKSIPSDLCNRRDLGFFIFKAIIYTLTNFLRFPDLNSEK